MISQYDKQSRKYHKLNPIELIKSLLKENNLTQKELAGNIGIGESYMSEILNYKKNMSRKVIRRIADFFRIQQEALNYEYALHGKEGEKDYTQWTESEIANLKMLVRDHKPAEIAKKLNRSEKAVRRKAQRENISILT